MTRRGALTALAGVVGAHAGSPAAQTVSGDFMAITQPALRFNLRGFSRYHFTLGDRTVTVSPEELMAALLGKEQP